MLCCQCIYWMNILVTTIWKRLSHLHLARSRPCWTWTSPTTVLVLSKEALLVILSVSAASSWITTSWRRSRGPQYLSTICTCLTIKSSKNHCLYWIHYLQVTLNYLNSNCLEISFFGMGYCLQNVYYTQKKFQQNLYNSTKC